MLAVLYITFSLVLLASAPVEFRSFMMTALYKLKGAFGIHPTYLHFGMETLHPEITWAQKSH
jgi:hypothetical protein